ncbi:MAG: MoxR family ATPase [Chloroflexi bacterium]|nr:MoxR family ATPase [Chloroflexota bacterium]
METTTLETAVENLAATHEQVRQELHRVIAGQESFVDELIICLFACGHSLIEGVPGLAKTLTVRTLASVLDMRFSRIQFTPDLMPTDIVGTTVLQEIDGRRSFEFVPGPVFANMVLADEINRAAPKTQSALLECMQEHRVTVGGKTYPLGEPFFVLATQNPVEHEGTYPLPEAQLDRFMFMIKVGYPTRDEEARIVTLNLNPEPQTKKVAGPADLTRISELSRQVPVADHVMSYIVDLVRASRPGPGAISYVNKYVQWGASPRACIFLTRAAQVNALLQHRFNVSITDVKRFAHPVLRHRIVPSFEAEAEEISVDSIIDTLLEGEQK